MQTSPMQQFLIEQLRTLYDAEKQLTKALPRMAKAATDEELAQGFRQHTEQTKEQAGRIEQIFQTMGVKARGAACAPMQALIEEGQQIISSGMEDAIRDIGLASAGRRVEHFEIAAYDALAAAAQSVKQTEIAQLLQETLREETETDKRLAAVAKRLLKESARAKPASEESDESAQRSSGRSSGRNATAGASGRSSGGQGSRSSRSGGNGSRSQNQNLSSTTIDHDEIRQWAEQRGGKPACVQGTGGKGDIGMLRIEFPGKPNAKDAKLQAISWDDFFEKFDERGLALVYQDTTSRGQKSNFNKLVSREGGKQTRSASR
jgi:ferritin-like metal-binding protein YciE